MAARKKAAAKKPAEEVAVGHLYDPGDVVTWQEEEFGKARFGKVVEAGLQGMVVELDDETLVEVKTAACTLVAAGTGPPSHDEQKARSTEGAEAKTPDSAVHTSLTIAPESSSLARAQAPPMSKALSIQQMDYADQVAEWTKVAAVLADIIQQRKLYKMISGKKHVLVEGWTVMMAMLGVTPHTVWTKPLSDPPGWEARVEWRTADGRVMAAGEGMCNRGESSWRKRDDFALRSMAQTRATSRGARQAFSFIVELAGYSPTPEEEMPGEVPREEAPATTRRSVEAARPAEHPGGTHLDERGEATVQYEKQDTSRYDRAEADKKKERVRRITLGKKLLARAGELDLKVETRIEDGMSIKYLWCDESMLQAVGAGEGGNSNNRMQRLNSMDAHDLEALLDAMGPSPPSRAQLEHFGLEVPEKESEPVTSSGHPAYDDDDIPF